MNDNLNSLEKVSERTSRTLRLWLKGKKEDLAVYRIRKENLYFNIENGRYADKLLQLRADNPGADIDPKLDKWKGEIFKMLKGEYTGSLELEGTERDKNAFDRLLEDIKKREQLQPGIVLSDGGVIDGNRRLAVIMSLSGPQFEYFEGIILPENVLAEDRWRIEVGIQLGKDQQLDYSPINKLLKIRQGLELFRSIKLPHGRNPEDVVSESLYGVSRKEVLDSIDRINLIDEYLLFFKIKGQYHRVADKGEQFIEAVKALRAAEDKLTIHEKLKLKGYLFTVINENIMSNWKLRDIISALGGISKSSRTKKIGSQKAINHIISHSTDPKMIADAYSENHQKKIVEKIRTISKEFQDIYEAENDANKPLSLVKDARTKLETLKESLKKFKTIEDSSKIKRELTFIRKLVKACNNSLTDGRKD